MPTAEVATTHRLREVLHAKKTALSSQALQLLAQGIPVAETRRKRRKLTCLVELTHVSRKKGYSGCGGGRRAHEIHTHRHFQPRLRKTHFSPRKRQRCSSPKKTTRKDHSSYTTRVRDHLP